MRFPTKAFCVSMIFLVLVGSISEAYAQGRACPASDETSSHTSQAKFTI